MLTKFSPFEYTISIMFLLTLKKVFSGKQDLTFQNLPMAFIIFRSIVRESQKQIGVESRGERNRGAPEQAPRDRKGAPEQVNRGLTQGHEMPGED